MLQKGLTSQLSSRRRWFHLILVMGCWKADCQKYHIVRITLEIFKCKQRITTTIRTLYGHDPIVHRVRVHQKLVVTTMLINVEFSKGRASHSLHVAVGIHNGRNYLEGLHCGNSRKRAAAEHVDRGEHLLGVREREHHDRAPDVHGLVAVLAGGTASWAVMTFVMETDFLFEPVNATAIILGGVLATTTAGLVFAWRPLAARPAEVLKNSD